MPGDIRVERGVAVFGASADSTSISFGTAAAAADKAFVRITNVAYCSAGPDTATAATRNNDDLGCYIDQTTVTENGFDLVRDAAGVNEDVRVHWELWDYVGPDGGAWEFSVPKRANVRATSGTLSGSQGISALNPSSYDNLTPVCTGVSSTNTGRNWSDASIALRLDKTTSSEAVDWQRGNAAATTNFSYCLVDWSGSAWTVENNITHQFTAAGVNETETITDVGSWDKAFIFHTYRTVNTGLDESTCNVWPGSTTTSMRFRMRSGATSAIGYVVEACTVSASKGLSVEHLDSITGTGADHGSGANTTSVTISSVDAEGAGAIASSDCAGAGTAYGRFAWGYRINNSTNAEFWRSYNGQTGDWAMQIVAFIGQTAQGDTTFPATDVSASSAGVVRSGSADTTFPVTDVLAGSAGVIRSGSGDITFAKTDMESPRTPPPPPDYTVPAEGDCHIIVDGSDSSYKFHNGCPGTDTTLGGVNPTGALNSEYNLIARALNQAVASKTYVSNVAAALTDAAYCNGPVIIGVKGNGGSLRLSYQDTTSSPAVRESGNSNVAWDCVRNNTPFSDAPAGYNVAFWGFNIIIVGLDSDAQMRWVKQGPQQGNIYDATENPSPSSAPADPTESVKLYNIKLRTSTAPGSGSAYYQMESHLVGDFYADTVEFLPCDPTEDGTSFNDITGGTNGNNGYDSKWGFFLNWNVVGTTLIRNCGTSGDFASTAQTRHYASADDAVVFREHNAYLKGGGDVFIYDIATTPSGTWPNQTLGFVHSNRTHHQIRPELTEDEWGKSERTGSVVVRDCTIDGHGSVLVTSTGVHPSDENDGGGAVITCWATQGDVWYWDNTVTNAEYQAMAIVDQSSTRNYLDAEGWPIRKVYLKGNTFSRDSTATHTVKRTGEVSGCRELHIYEGNTFADGSNTWDLTINVEPGGSVGGSDRDIVLVYEYPNADIPGMVGADLKAWDRDTDTMLTVNQSSPVTQIPEWVVTSDYNRGWVVRSGSGDSSAAETDVLSSSSSVVRSGSGDITLAVTLVDGTAVIISNLPPPSSSHPGVVSAPGVVISRPSAATIARVAMGSPVVALGGTRRSGAVRVQITSNEPGPTRPSSA